MKKLLLAFVFLPMLSFAQSKTLNDTIPGIKNSKLIICKPKKDLKIGYSIDGKDVDYASFIAVNMDLVDDLKFTKPNSKYPDGKIELFLKKNKQTKKSNYCWIFFACSCY